MELSFSLCLLGILSLWNLVEVQGHGMMLEPASRNSAWRYGWGTPVQHTDNELNCGGAAAQKANGGKCGVCGDVWNQANTGQYVHGGKYATGTIVAEYKEGEIIESDIRVTANHKGTYEWWLGDIGTPPISIQKLKHLLTIVSVDDVPFGGTHWELPGTPSKVINKFKLQLPAGVSCAHCVLQWWWKVGNSWGCDQDIDPDRFGKPFTGPNKCCVGCGHQETFVNCADVKIDPDDGSVLTTAATPEPPKPPTIAPTTLNPNQVCFAIGPNEGEPEMDHWCNVNCPNNCPVDECECTYFSTTASPETEPPTEPPTQPPVTEEPTAPTQKTNAPKTRPPVTVNPGNGDCKAAGLWKGQDAIADWCVDNCKKNHCPASHCSAGCRSLLPPATPSETECEPRGLYYHDQDSRKWCNDECSKSTAFCSQSVCSPGCLLLAPPPSSACHAIAPYNYGDYDNWCVNNCSHNPPYCPATHCSVGCLELKKKDAPVKRKHPKKGHRDAKSKKRDAKARSHPVNLHHKFKFHPRNRGM